MLTRIIAKNEEEYDLEQAIFETVSSIINGPDDKNYDEYVPPSNLLSLADFTGSILVAFAAISLIQLDLPGLDSFEDVKFERKDSKQFGYLVRPENDNDAEVHEIHRENGLATKRVGSIDEAGLPNQTQTGQLTFRFPPAAQAQILPLFPVR
jgi:hypothetical protein